MVGWMDGVEVEVEKDPIVVVVVVVVVVVIGQLVGAVVGRNVYTTKAGGQEVERG